MRVFGLATDAPEEWTAPFPTASGYKLRLMGGDEVSPDDWHRPTRVRRRYFRFPCRPFFSMRIGRFGFYIGSGKVFGVDNEDLKKFPSINPVEVYVGSQAIQGWTVRFTGNVP